MSLILKNTASGFADLKRADDIRPREDFDDLCMPGDLPPSLQDTVSIFD